ncbi:hypothetical protein FRC17_008472, partial [Serendipita sp. 399]
QAVYVGDGTNEWNNVHIADLVDLYILVTQLATSELVPAAKVDSFHKFFWGSVGTHTWGDVAGQIGVVLKQKGLAETAEAKSIPYSDEFVYVSPHFNAEFQVYSSLLVPLLPTLEPLPIVRGKSAGTPLARL